VASASCCPLPSVAYLYYEPGMRAESAPEMFEVQEEGD
jgi:hypothetical protein